MNTIFYFFKFMLLQIPFNQPDLHPISADIISLQEVEMEQFYNFFLKELKRDGYEVITM